MPIQFDTIPTSIRKPGKYFEFNLKLASRTLPANLQKMLIVAQKLAAGSAAANVPVQVYSSSEAAELFGSGSLACLMVVAALKAYRYLDLTVLPIADAAASVAATGTITIAGPATSSGLLTLKVGNKSLAVAIAQGDTATDIATALQELLAQTSELPVTAAVNGAVLTLTAKNAGTLGNQIPLSASVTAGSVTATIVAMASGVGDPDITAALAVIVGQRYHVIALSYNDQANITALRTHLDAMSHARVAKSGIGVYATTGAMAAATTLSAQINGWRISAPYLRGTASLPCEVAAAYAALAAGEEDPARPLNTLQLTGIAVPPIASRLSDPEQESCLQNGVSPLAVGSGEVVQIVRAITTYTKNSAGNPDATLLDITTPRQLDYVRDAARTRVDTRFPREKLNNKTCDKVWAELYDVLKKCEELEIVENVDENKDALVVERNAQDVNRCDAAMPADVVNGLQVLASRIDLIL